jgi:hypothetical protein
MTVCFVVINAYQEWRKEAPKPESNIRYQQFFISSFAFLVRNLQQCILLVYIIIETQFPILRVTQSEQQQ